MVRLSLVNLYLHGFTDPHIFEYDTLTSEERWNELSDVILANPPFVSPTGGIKPHRRFSIQAKRSEVLTEHGPCDRDTAIKQAATSLGYQRVRAGLSTTLINAIRTAVKRQVLSNQGGQLSLSVSSISGYEMDFLKSQFLAALSERGRVWTDREDAILSFARWLGFRRTGSVIDETARKLINRLLRDGRLEKDGDSIRRI